MEIYNWIISDLASENSVQSVGLIRPVYSELIGAKFRQLTENSH